MKAMIINEFGPPEVLHYEDVPDPVPGENEVLIKVHAVSVNRVLDVAVRQGNQLQRGVKLPHILGVDPSGEIVGLGPGVTEYQVGDRVSVLQQLPGGGMFGIHCWGGNAELTKAPVSSCVRIPDAINYPEATVISRHGPVAFNLLYNMGKLEAGQWVLILGPAGNLGSIGIQLAKATGAHVIAAAGSAERAAIGKELGADHVIDYSTQDIRDEVMKVTDGEGVHLFYDNIANPETCSAGIESLRHDGRMVTAGAHGGPIVPVNMFTVYDRRLSIMGSPRSRGADADPCFKMAAEHRMRILIEKVVPLGEAAAVHAEIESSPGVGKIILDPTLG